MWRERIVSLWTNAPIFYESSNDLIQYIILHTFTACVVGWSVLPQSQNFAYMLGEPMRIGMIGPQTKKNL